MFPLEASISRTQLKRNTYLSLKVDVFTYFKPKASNKHCGGLTLSGNQLPVKAALSLPSLAGQGRENIRKGSWAGIRIGSSLTKKGQTRLDLGK